MDHYNKDYRKHIAAKKRTKYSNDKPVRRLLVTTAYFNHTRCDDNWYIDIGATHHMVHNKDLFYKYKQFSSPELVYLGDDTTQDIIGEGEVNVHLPQGEIITICNVLHIPNLKKNLFSVKHLDDNNGDIHIRNGRCTLKDSTGSLIAICYRENDLYKLGESYLIRSQILANPATTSINGILWHRRFGYISTQRLQ
jgi:hypothetical protein